MKSDTALLLLLGLLFIGGGGYAVYELTRNVRNKNPGNIRYDGTVWQGLDNPPSDGEYARFSSALYGFRALGRVLTNYVTRDGITPTVRAIISRFAPPSENNTQAYINDICAQLNVGPDDLLSIPNDLPALALGIANHEGYNSWTLQDATQGVSLA